MSVEGKIDKTPEPWHNLCPDEYEAAELEAAGALAGWLLGKGVDPPQWTPDFRDAFRRAVAAAFDWGYQTGAEDRQNRW